ncbi:hypothetical protein [Desulfovibrio subterraneus]|uniref:Uncharacterized protein n=1 Tax=Desulfovibrio subterraneus TaxID=2718620 RepID=A0A7J0BN26_9BACT|nr:hypothetical protein [Desulfovibrio subterraneus]GFM35147.1 hypothetical protein DSM101010T_35120 [Desulfovibrio subterraneus]
MTVTFCYRGKRDYILGADILDYVLQEASISIDASGYDFLVVKKAHGICRISDSSSVDADSGRVAALKIGSQEFSIFETDDKPVLRVVCDESSMSGFFTIDESGSCVNVSSPINNASFARSAVVAFKYLLNSILGNEGRSYLFVRLNMKAIPSASFAIRYARIVAKKFYEGVIVADGNEVGRIYFSEGVSNVGN